MNKIKTMAIFVILIHALSLASWAVEIDSVEINEALYGGLLYVSFSGSKDSEEMNVTIERKFEIPLIVVINKGSTMFHHGRGEITIVTSKAMSVDLSEKMQDTIIVSQTGNNRFYGKMTIDSWLTKKTAALYPKFKHSKDLLLEKIIAALDQEETWKRSSAAKALGEIGDKQAIPKLKSLFANDPDANVRKAAKEALKKIQN